MNQKSQERRRYQRLFFSAEESITGIFRLSEPYQQHAVAGIMDLNPEGIGITFHKDECPQLVSGESLTLLKVPDSRLEFMENIEMRIQWVLNHRSLEHMAMGCEFMGISSAFIRRVDEIMQSWPLLKTE